MMGRYLRLIIVGWICCLWIPTTIAQTPQASAADVHVVPLHIDYDLLFVSVKLNGQGPFRLLLDTGTQGTYVTDKVIQALDLQPIASQGSEIKTDQTSRTAHKQTYKLDTMQIGGMTLQDVTVSQLAVLNDTAGILKTLESDGLLGVAALQSLILTLDVPKRRVLLQQAMQPWQVNGTPVPFVTDNYLPVIQVDVINKGQHTPAPFLLDTGFTGTFKMPFCFQNGLNHFSHDPTQVSDVFKHAEPSASGVFPGKLQIGDLILSEQTVLYPLEQCDQTREWGLIGNQFFNQHVVRINFLARELLILS